MSNDLQVLKMYGNLLGNVGVATDLFSHQLYQNNNITQHNTVLTIFSGKNVKHHPGTGDEAQE